MLPVCATTTGRGDAPPAAAAAGSRGGRQAWGPSPATSQVPQVLQEIWPLVLQTLGHTEPGTATTFPAPPLPYVTGGWAAWQGLGGSGWPLLQHLLPRLLAHLTPAAAPGTAATYSIPLGPSNLSISSKLSFREFSLNYFLLLVGQRNLGGGYSQQPISLSLSPPPPLHL